MNANLSTKQKSILLVYGYIRSEFKSNTYMTVGNCNKICTDMTNFIEMYYFVNKYMDILKYKQNIPNSFPGFSVNKEIIQTTYNKTFNFNTSSCPHCLRTESNILKFVMHYKESITNKIGFCHVVNEYQCKLCTVFIAHMLKKNIIANNRYEYQQVSPLPMHGEIKDMLNKKQNGKCYECKGATIELYDKNDSYTSSSEYFCVNCGLFHYKQFMDFDD
eukprot:30029_1